MTHQINLDEDTAELINWHAAATGLTVSDLIDRLLSTHLPDLHELRTLMNSQPSVREEATNLLVSFGPDSLALGIKRIAPPGYQTEGARFTRSLSSPHATKKASVQ
jgi:hypothetical protein